MIRTFMYHPTIAPEGRIFADEEAFHALGPEWVDTPAKFPPPEPELEEPPKRRGRKPQTEPES